MIRIDIQFAFLRGEYAQYDMSGLDLRLVRDWAMFTALSFAGQGTNRETAWTRYLNNTGGTPLAELCRNMTDKKSEMTTCRICFTEQHLLIDIY